MGVGYGVWRASANISDIDRFDQNMRTGDTLVATGLGLFVGGASTYGVSKVLQNRSETKKDKQ